MDVSSALRWTPPGSWERLVVIDSHTGGEPFRVVVDGLPPIPGDTVLERRRYAMDHLDHLRRAMVLEPRGHTDMYAGWPGPPIRPDSDLSVLFVHNEGFSTMCGHGIIALTKVVLDTEILSGRSNRSSLRIDTPAGQVTAEATMRGRFVESVRFLNVASFAMDLDAFVEVDGYGEVRYDLAFGGAFYAYVAADEAGVDIDSASQLVEAGRAIKHAVLEARTIEHPEEPDLGFLYGVVFTGQPTKPGNHSRHVCVFADGEVDRSPTGTGVSGRLALLDARGEIERGERIVVESIVGSEFTGEIAGSARVGDHPAVIPRIGGSAHITGRSEFWLDPDDELGGGFLIR